jgi:hypothetical protein
MLNMPIAGSIVSSTGKETLGWYQAHVTWTHSWSTSVGLSAPPREVKKKVQVNSINDP